MLVKYVLSLYLTTAYFTQFYASLGYDLKFSLADLNALGPEFTSYFFIYYFFSIFTTSPSALLYQQFRELVMQIAFFNFQRNIYFPGPVAVQKECNENAFPIESHQHTNQLFKSWNINRKKKNTRTILGIFFFVFAFLRQQDFNLASWHCCCCGACCC